LGYGRTCIRNFNRRYIMGEVNWTPKTKPLKLNRVYRRRLNLLEWIRVYICILKC
jgi:hypothetical protein